VDELHVVQELSKGVDDMCHIQIARRDFMEHWGKERKVLLIDQRDILITVTGKACIHLQSGI
jgi:hypothetical protein